MLDLKHFLKPRILVLYLAFYYFVVLLIYIPDMGGSGLNLPHNILCWLAIELLVMMVGLAVIKQKTFNWNITLLCFFIGAVLMTIPMAWGKVWLQVYALPRIVGLWGGVIFYFALLQYSLTCRIKRQLMFILLCGTLLQSFIAFWQVSQISPENSMEFVPGTRPYGIFQQVNVLASFVATGFAIATWMLFRARQWRTRSLWLVSVAFFTITLDLLQSRAGIAGIIVYVIFIVLVRFEPRTKGVFSAFFGVVVLSIFTIHLLKYYGVDLTFLQQLNLVDKTDSTSERIFILKATLDMIAQHPLRGWGYGSFEYQIARTSLHHFQHAMNVDHAHNEFLFEWAEGGVMAVAGMLFIACGFLWPLRYRLPRATIALCGLVLPIVFHLMVEYPLIQSAPHLMTLLILCRLVVPARMLKIQNTNPELGWLMPMTASFGLIFLLTGFRTGTVLTQFERDGMRDFTVASSLSNPWIQWDRWQYDKYTALLIQYNTVHDPVLLDVYARWGVEYLKRRNDLRVFENLILINHVYPNVALTAIINKEGRYYSALKKAIVSDNRLIR